MLASLSITTGIAFLSGYILAQFIKSRYKNRTQANTGKDDHETSPLFPNTESSNIFIGSHLNDALTELDLKKLVLRRFLPIVSSHLNNLPPDIVDISIADEKILRHFGPHLHQAVYSRAKELSYLRGLIQRILHLDLIPPYLSHSHEQQQHSASKKGVVFSQPGRINQTQLPNMVEINSNPVLFAFLSEIFSGFCLLPAMDSAADPDQLNRLITDLLPVKSTEAEATDHLPNTTKTCKSTLVPVLASYVDEIRRWLDDKPKASISLEYLLESEDLLQLFMQYMKSIHASKPLTLVVLLHEIDRRLRQPLTLPFCQEIHAQLRHIHLLLTDVGMMATDDDSTDSLSPFPIPVISRQGLPEDFLTLISSTLARSPADLASLTSLAHSPIWTNGLKNIFREITNTYLKLFQESPDWLAHVFRVEMDRPGVQRERHSTPSLNRTSSNSPRKHGRVKSRRSQSRGQATASSTSLVTASRPPVDNRGMTSSSSDLQPRYQQPPPSSLTIDMADWMVSIPCLTRPERYYWTRSTNSMSGFLSNYDNDSDDFEMVDEAALTTIDYVGSTGGGGDNRLRSQPQRPAQLASQFCFSVRVDRPCQHEVAVSSTTVFRKYADFYWLEQKLIEFHGDAFINRLPRRFMGKRTLEFLESRRPIMTAYLRSLITHPVLRKSELLHRFLTRDGPFQYDSMDRKLEGLVRKVPIILTKEKGQYLDEFLAHYQSSCQQNQSNPMLTFSSKLAPYHHHKRSDSNEVSVESLLDFKYFAPSATTSRYHSSRRPKIDRSIDQTSQLGLALRSRLYWNNAGLSDPGQLDCTPRASESVNFNGSIGSMLLFALVKLQTHPPRSSPSTRSFSSTVSSTSSVDSDDNEVDTATNKIVSIRLSDLGQAMGQLARLIKSLVARSINRLIVWFGFYLLTNQPTIWHDAVDGTLHRLVDSLLNLPSSTSSNKKESPATTINVDSSNGGAATTAENNVTKFLLTFDSKLALLVENLTKQIVDPEPLQTDAQRLENRDRAVKRVDDFISSIPYLSWLVDEVAVKSYAQSILTSLQRPKVNKQLVYTLLDQFMISLFPELDEK